MELVNKKNNYDEFLKTRFISGNFLQSSIWQDFLDKQKKVFWQVAVIENNQTIASCLLYENKLMMGRSYLYAPKGPIISNELSDQKIKQALGLILSRARDIAISTTKKEEIFFKVELEKENLPELTKCPDVQPRDTWVLDIDKDPKELLGDMHQKTRYNIALARRHGVTTRFSKDEKDIKDFLRLIKKTYSRNQITAHSDDYYKTLFKVLLRHGAGQLCLAEVNKKVIAANMIIRFGPAVTYLHGASDYKFRKHMAPQLLQWETIKQSIELGYKVYDFWGIAPEDDSKPNWAGITRFKKSFGGRAVTSPGSHNLIYDKNWYKVYQLIGRLRKVIKR
ncbi:peptidoglycan bridge formation glycyltransferase FemA/FemB family protein [Candidatus Parcubacteria bacterium]|jgi:lipid II:glycine glycyltransferase (peptidoglycan interpeptide bridge formation enzyme)|nr:peptidoglycan bridge formation glycyltransferase FemA/FemB family protein [Candidatus Parcubacteria bacterium]